MICDIFDVVVVPFPFTEMAVSKFRPAVSLSRVAFNTANENTVLAMITTAKASLWPSDLPILDIAAAGLITNCYVRWKVFTLPNGLIQRMIGHLAATDQLAMQSAAQTILI